MVLLEGLKWLAFLIIIGTIWKLTTARFADTRIGEGMAFIYN